jgi:uncharacterized protein (TIGR02246 family)
MTNDTREHDLAAIRGVVAELERAQQHELPDAFIALFRPDAVWTTAHGKRLVGRDEIAAFTHKVLPGAMKESTASYEVTHVVFARPDVAVVQVRQRPIKHGGEPLDDQPEGRPVYVMANEPEGWKLVAGQNTQVKNA